MPWLIPPLALLAGYVAWTRLPMGAGERDDGLESAFAMVVSGVLVTGLAAFLLAEAGWLRPWALVSVLTIVGVLGSRRRRRLESGPAPSGRETAGVLLLAVLLGATVAPGSEDVFGGRDQGVYVSTAGWIASEGSLRIRSEALSEVATLEGGPFPLRGLFIPGYHVADAARGELAPYFFHLHPVYMALGAWLGGIEGALVVPPLLGVLSELAVFFFLRRMLGTGAALAGTVLLALNLAQVWGMRNPYSETFAQLSVFCTLWCLQRGHATGGVRWGILGGAALGANFLNRIDAPLVLLALLPALTALQADAARAPSWIVRALLPGTLLLAAWGVAHGAWLSPTYFAYHAGQLLAIWPATGVALGLVAAALVRRRQTAAILASLHRRGRLVWVAAAAVLCAAFVFGLWIRPRLEPFHVFPHYGIRSFREESLVRVGWYFSLAGMFAALSGVLLLLRRWLAERRTEWAPFLLLFLTFSCLFFTMPHVDPDHPWMMRRFLPVIVPGILIAAIAAASALWSAGGRWRWGARAAAAIVVIVVAGHELRMTAPFWSYREQHGAVRQVAELARHVPEDALLLIRRVGVAVRLATPLALHWDRAILPVIPTGTAPEAQVRRSAFDAQVRRWLDEGREVLFLTSRDGDSAILTELVEWHEVRRFDLTMTSMNAGSGAPPRRPGTLVEPYRLLRAAPVEPGPCAPRTLRAASPMLGMAQGVFRAESHEAEPFRWIGPEARVVFPLCDRTGDGRPRWIRVRGGCLRPPCAVAVTVNGELAGVLELGRRFSNFDLPIPEAAVSAPSGALEVRFRGPRFVPAEAGLGADSRVLSFQLAELAVRGRSECATAGDAAVLVAAPRRGAVTAVRCAARSAR